MNNGISLYFAIINLSMKLLFTFSAYGLMTVIIVQTDKNQTTNWLQFACIVIALTVDSADYIMSSIIYLYDGSHRLSVLLNETL